MRTFFTICLFITTLTTAFAQGIYISPHISAGIVPGHAGLGLGAGYGFKKISIGIDASTGLFGGTSGNYFQTAEVVAKYNISRSVYAGAALGYNTLTADTYYGEGVHVGLLLGTSSKLDKHWRIYFEGAPKICFDNIDDFKSRTGVGYYTNAGTQTKFIILFNIGVTYNFAKAKQ